MPSSRKGGSGRSTPRNIRVQRIGSEMQKALSVILTELKDPRVTEIVSVTEVEVSNDLSFAKAYLSIYGDEDKKQSTFDAIVASAGFISKEMSRVFKDMRIVPKLRFEIDGSMDYAQKINNVLNEINNKETEENE